jgi:hypothetical protein
MNQKEVAMAVPDKPTARLTLDGVIGKKTRDAAAYAMNCNAFTNGTTMATMGSSQYRTNLQLWLNQDTYWTYLNEDPESSSWDDKLIIDGVWGVQTENKLGGTMIYLSSGDMQDCDVSDVDLGKAGRMIKMFQALLNGVIFREKPTGPAMYLRNTVPTWQSGNVKWLYEPPSRY